MICSRCRKKSDTSRMERNAEIYDTPNLYACPYCGKAHYIKRVT
jgi:DNA-directed RNA polymerase subunit RPC12/RpoP